MSFEPSELVELGDLLRQPRLVDLVRQLGHDDLRAPVRALLHLRDRPDLERAATGLVDVLDALAAHDRRAGREVGPLDELHEVPGGRVRVVQEVRDRVDRLAEVVRRDVGGHADGDPTGAVHEQVREAAGQDDRLLLVPVEVRDEVDGLGLDVAQHLHRHGRETRLRVAVRGRRIAVDGAEVPVPVDERVSQRPVLGHPNEGVVDGLIAVRVVLLQHVADDRGALAVGAVGAVPGLEHRPQDPLVDRLQPVADVGEGTSHDDRHGVVEVRALDLVLELDVLDAAGEQVL